MSTINSASTFGDIVAAFRINESGFSWHGYVVLIEWTLLTLGVIALFRKRRSMGVVLMLVSLAVQALGGLLSPFAVEFINRHQAFWIPMSLWTLSTLLFCTGFMIFVMGLNKGPNQPVEPTSTAAPRGTL